LEKVEKGDSRKLQRGHRMMHWTHRKEGDRREGEALAAGCDFLQSR